MKQWGLLKTHLMHLHHSDRTFLSYSRWRFYPDIFEWNICQWMLFIIVIIEKTANHEVVIMILIIQLSIHVIWSKFTVINVSIHQPMQYSSPSYNSMMQYSNYQIHRCLHKFFPIHQNQLIYFEMLNYQTLIELITIWNFTKYELSHVGVRAF